MKKGSVVLASGNAGKLAELKKILAPLGLQLKSQADFAVPEVEETGLTFVENAILKARAAASGSGLPALADDSGLEVDALRGQGKPTLPTTIAKELTTNPFLRACEPAVKAALRMSDAADWQVFGEIRTRKDNA